MRVCFYKRKTIIGVLLIITVLIAMNNQVFADEQTHPFLLVRPNQYSDLRSRSSQEPWSGMKTRAINECTQRSFPPPCNGNLNTSSDEYPELNSEAFCMRAIMGACSLAYILDPDNKDTYLNKVINTLPNWEHIIVVQSGADDGTRNTSNEYYTDATAAYFNTLLAVDIMHEDLTNRPGPQDSQYQNQLVYAEFLMEQEFNHFYGITKPVYNFQTKDGRTLSYHMPSRHPPAQEAALILWKIYKGEFSPNDSDSNALLFGGMLSNNFPDPDGDGDNIEGFLPELSARVNSSGVYTEGSSYAYAGWGLDRDERSHLVDVLEFTGKDTEFGLDFYTNPRFQAFYEWLYGYASTPFGVMTSFGDTYAFRQLIDSGHGGNSWANSSHIGQAGKFSPLAGSYAALKTRNQPQQGRLLNYMLYTPLPPNQYPKSRIFQNGGGFFLSQPVEDKSLYAALWNVQEPTEGSVVFHTRKDVNALYIAAYGTPLLLNGGFCGTSSPIGPDSCAGVDENGVQHRFSGLYLGDRAISNNVGLVNYSVGSNYLEPANDNNPSKFGSGVLEGFTAEKFDYVSASTTDRSTGTEKSSLSQGEHQRSLIFIHPDNGANGYFISFDEFSDIPQGTVHLAWHPNAESRQVITQNTEFKTTAARKFFADNETGLTFFFGTEPSNIQFYRGIIATAGSVGAYVPEYFLNTYPISGAKNIVTVLFPHDSSHIKAVMQRISESNISGARVDHGNNLIDLVLESNAESAVTYENSIFQAKAAIIRKQGTNINSFFIRKGRSFRNNQSDTYGFTSQSDISIYLNNNIGMIVSPNTNVTFRYPGIEAVKINDQIVTPISSQQGSITVSVPAGTHSIELTTDNSTPSPTPVPGDANNDGKIDGLDYVVWLTHYNTNASGAQNGDFNNNGRVDGLDYVIWLNNYGS